jgi:methylated-DNA-[protein]-cysteine S-methyltransferase
MPSRIAVITSPIGLIALESDGRALRGVRLQVREPVLSPADAVLRQAAREIEEYFAGRRRSFSVPLHRPTTASAFQHRVWDELERIPFGETRTYGEIARHLGTSPRALGGACARNALPLFIPCHRVVARTGLGGFSGDWETGRALDVKQVLLAHEAGGSDSTHGAGC